MSRRPSAPAASAALAWATALAVLPAAGRGRARAGDLVDGGATTRSVSSKVSEKPSPVPPAANSPATGYSASQARCLR